MPRNEDKSLDGCIGYFFGEYQPVPHNALMDAMCVKKICENLAVEEEFESFYDYLDEFTEFLHDFD